ncbi:hypothetical protein [Tenacibaculum aiptasiae]|uniref:hypothetical protein n=1 Tax=Tenacibaculum aiptasiae TaxID=426481 RepID=UPI003B5C93EC
MKIVKVILSVLLILISIVGFIQSEFSPSIFTLLLGILLIPQVSKKIKEAFNQWNNKAIRYTTYGLLFILMGVTVPEVKKSNKNYQTTPNTSNLEKLQKKSRIINLDDKFWDASGKEIKPSKDDITYRIVDFLKHNKSGVKGSKNASEHMHLLIETNSYDKNTLKEIIERIKNRYATFAPEQCNIDFWDSKKAYEKYLEREIFFKNSFDNLMKEFKRTRKPIGDKYEKLKLSWDRKNYPFIAEHYPASISFNNKFYYFPFKDEHYNKIKGNDSKK